MLAAKVGYRHLRLQDCISAARLRDPSSLRELQGEEPPAGPVVEAIVAMMEVVRRTSTVNGAR
jgi:hypothetical protein